MKRTSGLIFGIANISNVVIECRQYPAVRSMVEKVSSQAALAFSRLGLAVGVLLFSRLGSTAEDLCIFLGRLTSFQQ